MVIIYGILSSSLWALLFLSMLVFVVRVIVYRCKLCVYFSGFYFATISGLSLSFPLPRCGNLYWVEIFRNGVTLLRSSCFTSVNLWGVYCFEYSSAAPYVHSTASPSYTNALILKRGLNRRGISSVYYPYWMCLYPLVNCARVCVFDMIGQEYPC